MRIRLAITLTLGDKPTLPDGDRYNDAMGHLQHAPDVDTGLGFHTPALTTEDE